ncbi:MAG: metalloregulator ArsR/SmtB family transcription factor [Gammaproteobacteria bacterium]|nr:metalloregulator ArsR/SmtB family transcription factor [Gammaproteobacteria bacterium]
MNAGTNRLLARFKALADPVRARLVVLCGAAECSVSELTEVTGLSQPRVSQHLKQLIAAGLLERFRDGHYVYYRVPAAEGSAGEIRRLLALLPTEEPEFRRDVDRLRELRSAGDLEATGNADDDRFLHRALVELTMSSPIGDLLDIGCGQGRLLKLLASRAHRVVGVDVDPQARRMARAELLLAGLPNCTLRQGDMYALPFDDANFDTIILDDVLVDAERPASAVGEAKRLLKDGGRILFLASVDDGGADQLKNDYASWAANTGLRLAPPRSIPEAGPGWLLGVATA